VVVSAAPAADAAARLRRLRWWILAAPAGLYLISYLHRISPAVVASDLMRAFAVPAATLGQLSAVYPYCFGIMGIPGGSLADHLGPRRTLTGGALTMGLGAAVFGLAPSFGVAFAGRLLVGLGASVMLLASLRLAAEWFRTDEFGTISGGSQAIGSLGALAATTPLALLVETVGWRGSFVTIGAVTVALGLACLVWVRDRPSDLGLPSVGPARPVTPASRAAVWEGIRSVAGNPRSWPPALCSAGIYGGFGCFIGLWGVPYMTQVYGLDRLSASNLVALAAVGLLIGAPLAGFVSDRVVRRRRPFLVAAALLEIAVWGAVVLPREPLPSWWLGPLCFALGLSSAGLAIVFATIREVNDPRHVGMAMGVQNTPVFLGFALLQWITGAALDARWAGESLAGARVYPLDAYRLAFAICLAVSIGAVVASGFVAETRCRNVWRPRPAGAVDPAP